MSASATNMPVTEQPKAIANSNKKIVENQEVQHISQAMAPGMNTSLCGCLEDIIGCLLSCCLPCIPAAVVQADLDGRECSLVDALCTPNPYSSRQTMRTKHNIEAAEFQDCCTACWCTPCFISQNVRELANRTNRTPRYFAVPKELGGSSA